MYSGKLRENAHPEEAPWSDGFLPVKTRVEFDIC